VFVAAALLVLLMLLQFGVLCAVCCVLLFVVFQEPERKASKGKMIWGETKKNPPLHAKDNLQFSSFKPSLLMLCLLTSLCIKVDYLYLTSLLGKKGSKYILGLTN
jgi:hypothetical protein